MHKMKTDILLRHWLMIALLCLFLAYVMFQSRYIIFGPMISILSHEDGFVSATPALTLSGRAQNVAWLSLNGRQIFIDEDGRWEESLLLASGLSIMSLEARDRFGRETWERVRIIYH